MNRGVVMAGIFLALTMAVRAGEPAQTQESKTDDAWPVYRPEDERSPEENKKRCEHWSQTNIFAGNLWSELRKKDGNIIASPAGAWYCMGLLALGAERTTRHEFALALKLEQQSTEDWLVEMKADTSTMKGKNVLPLELKISAGVWAGSDVPLDKNYLDGVKRIGHVSALPDDSKKAAEEVNKWASDATGGTIKELMRAQDLASAPQQVVAASAVYFKGQWEYEFDDAVRGTFHASGDKKIDAAMMSIHGKLVAYMETPTLRVARLKYLGSPTCSMLVMLPKKESDLEAAEKSLAGDGFAKLLEGFRARSFEGQKIMEEVRAAEKKIPDEPKTREEKMDRVIQTVKAREILAKANAKLPVKRLALTMPRFEFESTFDLIGALQAMGIKEAFTAKADFGQMASGPMQIKLVRQKSWIKVDEKGTEAGSATVAVGVFFDAENDIDEAMAVDRPFLFAIVSDATDLVLFSGRVTEVPVLEKMEKMEKK